MRIFGRYQIFQTLHEATQLRKNRKARRNALSSLEFTKKISNILLGKWKIGLTSWEEISHEIVYGLVEYWQSKHRKTVVFAPSELVRWLSGCTFDVRDEELRLPIDMELVTFAFENPNDALPSLIAQCTIYHLEELSQEVGLPLPFEHGGRHDSSYTVLVDHMVGDDLAVAGASTVSGEALLHDSVNVIGPDHFGDTDMVRKTIKVTAKLCVYLAAFPDALQPGAPKEIAENEPKSFKTMQRPKCFHLLTPKIDLEGEIRPHMRRGHFRSLRSERYHRDDRGNVRIVYVRPTFVHGDIDPYTAI